MPGFKCFVSGKPETKGSAKAYMPKGARFPIVTNDNTKCADWASLIQGTIRIAGSAEGVDKSLPCKLRATFRFHRTKGDYGSGKKTARTLKASAPSLHTKKPDADKLVRAVADALTGLAWIDDSQVVEMVARKEYADLWTEEQGVLIEVEYLTGDGA